MLKTVHKCLQCGAEHRHDWKNNGVVLYFIGAGIIGWSIWRCDWFDFIVSGVLFALPCFVFGHNQGKKSRRCSSCRNDLAELQ